MKNYNVVVSSFRGVDDSVPVRLTVPWHAFVAGFAAPRAADCFLANCRLGHCTHKSGAAWSPAIYPSGVPRRNCNVEAVSLLVLDLDCRTERVLQEALAGLAGYRRMIHATHSDRPPGCNVCSCIDPVDDVHKEPCPSRVSRHVRVVLDLSRPVKSGEWKLFWDRVTRFLQQPVDRSACAVGRIYYMPSQPRDAGSYLYEVHEGTPLDVDAILASGLGPSEVKAAPMAVTPTFDPTASLKRAEDVVTACARLRTLAGLLRFGGCSLVEIEAALQALGKMSVLTESEIRSVARWAAVLA